MSGFLSSGVSRFFELEYEEFRYLVIDSSRKIIKYLRALPALIYVVLESFPETERLLIIVDERRYLATRIQRSTSNETEVFYSENRWVSLSRWFRREDLSNELPQRRVS